VDRRDACDTDASRRNGVVLDNAEGTSAGVNNEKSFDAAAYPMGRLTRRDPAAKRLRVLGVLVAMDAVLASPLSASPARRLA